MRISTMLLIATATTATAACAATSDDAGTVLGPPEEGKEDGTSQVVTRLTPQYPVERVSIFCEEWISCDLKVRAQISPADVAAATGPIRHGVSIHRDGSLEWSGFLIAYGPGDFNGFHSTNIQDVIDGRFDPATATVRVHGHFDSVFDVFYTLGTTGPATLTTSATWW